MSNSTIEQYKILHKTEATYGAASFLFDEICMFIDYLQPKTVLDYGCGKGALLNRLKEAYPNICFYGYDPAIECRDVLPIEKADLVINIDVLEHIPEDEIEEVMAKIASISQNVIFNLHHALAYAILPNGENAHCTVKPLYWYYDLFSKYFKTQTILRGRSEWTNVVLTFPILPHIMENYYNIINPPLAVNINRPVTLLEKIFSVKNEYQNEKKHKVIRFLGIKIKLKSK